MMTGPIATSGRSAQVFQIIVTSAVIGLISPVRSWAVELKPPTIAAFERYARLTEARMDAELREGVFLLTDGLPEARWSAVRERLRRGELILHRNETRDRGQRIEIPMGLIHHWTGIVFIPGATLQATAAMAQDYDRHWEFFPEVIKQSKLRSRDGNELKVYLRFMLKKILTGVVNTESDVVYFPVDATRLHIRARSTRVAEVGKADTPQEHEFPVGNDHGYMWRVNSYWRLQEKDGGTYLQCEWLSLSRDIPFGLGWLINPIVTGLSRDTLQLMLLSSRRVVTQMRPGRATGIHPS